MTTKYWQPTTVTWTRIPAALQVAHGEVKTISIASGTGSTINSTVHPFGNQPGSGYLQGIDLNFAKNMFDQCACFLNPYWGPFGTYMMAGGGHSAYRGNEMFAFPIDLQRWYRMTDPYPDSTASPGTSLYVTSVYDATYNEWKPDWNGKSGSTDHRRDDTCVIPGGTNGRGIVVQVKNSNWLSQEVDWGHYFDCGLEDLSALTYSHTVPWWSRATNQSPTHSYGGKLWYEQQSGLIGYLSNKSAPRIWHLNKATGVWTGSEAYTNAIATLNNDTAGDFLQDRKLLMHTNGGPTGGVALKLELFDFSSGPPYQHVTIAAASITNASLVDTSNTAFKYCPRDGCFYMMALHSMVRSGFAKFLRLTPSVDLRNPAVTNAQVMAANWSVSDVTPQLTGVAIDDSAIRAVAGTTVVWWQYSSLEWVQPLDAFIWCFGVTAKTQLISPPDLP